RKKPNDTRGAIAGQASGSRSPVRGAPTRRIARDLRRSGVARRGPAAREPGDALLRREDHQPVAPFEPVGGGGNETALETVAPEALDRENRDAVPRAESRLADRGTHEVR